MLAVDSDFSEMGGPGVLDELSDCAELGWSVDGIEAPGFDPIWDMCCRIIANCNACWS